MMEWGSLLQAFLIVVVPCLLIGLVIWFLNRPKFHKGDTVFFNDPYTDIQGTGIIIGHDNDIARRWAIDVGTTHPVFIYEGHIVKR